MEYFSYSVGQFHYQTDGFRQNNDLRNDLVNGFFQVSLSPKLSIQAEVRHKEFERGDLDLFADDSSKPRDANARREINSDTVRAGAHFTIDERSDVIASYIHLEGDDLIAFTSFDKNRNLTVGRDFAFAYGNSGEAEYLFRTERFNAVAGVGYSSSGAVTPDQTDHTSLANGYL